MFSGLILIGRRLDRKGGSAIQKRSYYLVLSDLHSKKKKRRSGGDSMMDTPVPIPNTEVKHHNGEDSTLVQK